MNRCALGAKTIARIHGLLKTSPGLTWAVPTPEEGAEETSVAGGSSGSTIPWQKPRSLMMAFAESARATRLAACAGRNSTVRELAEATSKVAGLVGAGLPAGFTGGIGTAATVTGRSALVSAAAAWRGALPAFLSGGAVDLAASFSSPSRPPPDRFSLG